MPRLSFVNVFSNDIVSLSGFYSDLFGFPEMKEVRSPIFRAINAGQCCIGFNAKEAYGLLQLSELMDVRGAKFLLNFDVDSLSEVDRMVPIAVAKGARLVKSPYKTYHNFYQAVFLDPESNVFRINMPGYPSE